MVAAFGGGDICSQPGDGGDVAAADAPNAAPAAAPAAAWAAHPSDALLRVPPDGGGWLEHRFAAATTAQTSDSETEEEDGSDSESSDSDNDDADNVKQTGQRYKKKWKSFSVIP